MFWQKPSQGVQISHTRTSSAGSQKQAENSRNMCRLASRAYEAPKRKARSSRSRTLMMSWGFRKPIVADQTHTPTSRESTERDHACCMALSAQGVCGASELSTLFTAPFRLPIYRQSPVYPHPECNFHGGKKQQSGSGSSPHNNRTATGRTWRVEQGMRRLEASVESTWPSSIFPRTYYSHLGSHRYR